VAAQLTGGVMVPMAAAVRRGLVLTKTWDGFAIAWPFSVVDVALGAPLDPKSLADPRKALETSIASLTLDLATS
jgi:lysophospholipid acyltransferase (LPLAT)-like uncharacterized protein